MNKFMDNFRKFSLEIITALVLGLAATILSLHTAHAVTVSRVDGLEKQLEKFRVENRADHKEILELLRNIK